MVKTFQSPSLPHTSEVMLMVPCALPFSWWCLGAELISDHLNAQQMLVSLGFEGLGRPSLLVLGVLIPGDSQTGIGWHKRSLLEY